MDEPTVIMNTGSDLVPILAIMVPIIAIITVPVIFWLFFKSRNKHRESIQLTLRALIENGQPLSPELLESLSAQPKPADKKEKDLRGGVILIAIGISFVLISVLSEGLDGDYRDMYQGFGFASIWLLLGLARLGLWKYSSYNESNDTD